MRRKNAATFLALVLVALVVAGCAGNEQASEDNTKNQDTNENTRHTDKARKREHHRMRVEDSKGENNSGKANGRKATLELQGDSGTEFSGSCTVGDQEPEEISGQIPASFTYKLKGKPLDCKINS